LVHFYSKSMKILLLSDIHANFPALEAVINFFTGISFDAICNCGDSLVYAPFPNETLHWLENNKVHSIVGNTDRKIRKLLKGKTFNKPRKEEKRIMYNWTAEQLDPSARKYLLSLKKSKHISIANQSIGLFHGSPEYPNEHIFANTAPERFSALADFCPCNIIISGHSHTPFHKQVDDTHFINPGSVGRMFDSNPAASCAVLTIKNNAITTKFYRIPWQLERTVLALKKNNLPAIYQTMFIMGKKLN
jgi:putative phosphoesterase